MQIQTETPGSPRGNQLMRLLTYSPTDVSWVPASGIQAPGLEPGDSWKGACVSLRAQVGGTGAVTVLQHHGQPFRPTSLLGPLGPLLVPEDCVLHCPCPSLPRPLCGPWFHTPHEGCSFPLVTCGLPCCLPMAPSLTDVLEEAQSPRPSSFGPQSSGHTSYLPSLSLNQGSQALLDPIINQDMLPQENVIISDAT